MKNLYWNVSSGQIEKPEKSRHKWYETIQDKLKNQNPRKRETIWFTNVKLMFEIKCSFMTTDKRFG